MILFKFPISRKLSILSNPKIDGFVKSPISALRFFLGISRTAKYAAFLGISRALILNFLLCRPKLTFYECIKINKQYQKPKLSDFQVCRRYKEDDCRAIVGRISAAHPPNALNTLFAMRDII